MKTTGINKAVISLLLLLLVFLILHRCVDKKNSEIKELEIIEHSLYEIDSLKVIIDSLQKVNESYVDTVNNTRVEIKVIEKWYEKSVDDITSQSTNSDCDTFRKYLSDNFK